jgi:hypothetical protein
MSLEGKEWGTRAPEHPVRAVRPEERGHMDDSHKARSIMQFRAKD